MSFYYWLSTDILDGLKNEAHWHFDFTNDRIRLNANENWHVGLVQATLPSCIINTAGLWISVQLDDYQREIVRFPDESVWSIKALISLADRMASHTALLQFLNKAAPYIKVTYSETTKRAFVTIDEGDDIAVNFSPALLSKLGFDSSLTFRSGQRYTGLTIPNPFIKDEHYLFVSNLVEPSKFDGEVLPIMDNFVIKFDERNTNRELVGSRLLNLYEPQHIKYLPVNVSSFNKLEFSVLNERFLPVRFCDEIGSLLFLFHFKKI